MAKKLIFSWVKRFLGGLNFLNTFNDMPKMDFIGGNDIIDKNPRAQQETGYNQPANNTLYAMDIGVISTIAKKYRVSINATGATRVIIFSYKIGENPISTVQINYTSGDTATDLYADIIAAFSSTIFAPIFTNVSTVDNALRFDIVTGFYGLTDYILTVTDDATPSISYPCNPLNDAISAEKTGKLTPIELINVGSNLQIFSTTGDKKIEAINSSSDIITFTVDTLYLSTLTNFADGEEVFLYETAPTKGMLLATLSFVSAGVYIIVGGVNPTTGLPLLANATPGGLIITRYPRSLSCIGEGEYDQTREDYYYTELLRSTNLNFRTHYQIQANGNITDNGNIYDWTDNLNRLKRLIYYGNIANGGFLTVYNSDAIYDLDSIAGESVLQLATNTAKVTLSIAKNGASVLNGAKPQAMYAAFVVFTADDGSQSLFSSPSNLCWTHASVLTGTGNSNDFVAGAPTSMALGILIEQIEQAKYTSFQIGIIQFSSATYTSYLLPSVQITSETMYIVDTGVSPQSYISWNATTQVEQLPFVFERAKSIGGYENYVIAANTRIAEPHDLTTWATTIALSIKSRTIQVDYDDTFSAMTTFINNGYNAVEYMTDYHLSLMPNDTYRIGIEVTWVNGAPNSTFFIADIPVDLSNKITDDTYPLTNIYQYYIEATNINMDAEIGGGLSVKDIVKDFRFTRVECNNQVLTTGLGIFLKDSTATPGDYHVSPQVLYQPILASIPDRLDRVFLISPDLQNSTGGASISYQAGDKVLGIEPTARQAGFLRQTGYRTQSSVDLFGDSSTELTIDVVAVETLLEGKIGQLGRTFMEVKSTSPAVDTFSTTYVLPYVSQNTRGGVIVQVDGLLSNALDLGANIIYYLRPYPAGVAYPNPPSDDRFFIVPQDKWYNEDTHKTDTIYSIFGGDCFGQKQFYKLTEEADVPISRGGDGMVGFYTFNRRNGALRGGRYPQYKVVDYLDNKYITESQYNGDDYSYDEVFTPRHVFQLKQAYNTLLRSYAEKKVNIYYSQRAISNDVAGANRLWKVLDFKGIDGSYGEIIHFVVLLGYSQNGMLIVFQPKRLTGQFFDNTANIVSNAGQLLMGTGAVMGRTGTDYTVFGCEHKQSVAVLRNKAGHDLCYWWCDYQKCFMRIGADGTSRISEVIDLFLQNYVLLGSQTAYNLEDAPAAGYGIHAVINQQSMEYICTMRLVKNAATYTVKPYQINDWILDPDGGVFGFENIPIMYKSLENDNVTVPTGASDRHWQRYDTYNLESMQFITWIWNENDNKWKTERTFNPKIYGIFNNTYVSSHPTEPNLIYQHDDKLNQALYYSKDIESEITATTNPLDFTITGAGIEAIFPTPFVLIERLKYIVKINGKNYEVIGTATDTLTMANIDDDDIMPQVTIENFGYSIVNSRNPTIQGIVNENAPSYVHFTAKSVKSTYPVRKTEYEGLTMNQPPVTGISVKSEEDNSESVYNGGFNTQIKNNLEETGLVEGDWLKINKIFRWGKKNMVLSTEITTEETQKTQ